MCRRHICEAFDWEEHFLSTDGWEYTKVVPEERAAKWWHVADAQIEQLLGKEEALKEALKEELVAEPLAEPLKVEPSDALEPEKPWKVSDEALERLSLATN